MSKYDCKCDFHGKHTGDVCTCHDMNQKPSKSVFLRTAHQKGLSRDEIEKEYERLFVKILDNQEPLGEEFKKVLDDHYWDLISDCNSSGPGSPPRNGPHSENG